MVHITIIICFFLFKSALSSGIAGIAVQTQSGGSVLDDQAQHKNLDTFGINSAIGNSGLRYAAGFSHEDEKKHALAQDSGGYNNVNNDRNSHENAQQYFGEQAQRQNAGSTSRIGQQGDHKKGHHKSGFQNSYHKEESENKSSFYDDANDQGGHFHYNSQDGGFHQAALDRNHGARLDGHLYANGNGQKGGYDKGGNYDRAQGNKQGYNDNGYYNNYQNQGLQNAGNAQGAAGRHEENGYYNNYHQQPHYYNNYNYAPRRTITIYEDPRDIYHQPHYRGYGGYGYEPYNRNVHLNYKSNPYQYYPHYYDGYYYR